MNLKNQINQVEKDILANGPNYPVLVIYQNGEFKDYALTTEAKVVDEEIAEEMTLDDLLKQLKDKINGAKDAKD